MNKNYEKKKHLNKGLINRKKKYGISLVKLKMGTLATIAMGLFSTSIKAQIKCTTDPDYYTNYTVAGDFNGLHYRPDDVVMINTSAIFDPGISLSADMLLNVSSNTPLLKTVPIVPSLPGNYTSNVSGRIVVGDFDNDNEDDFIMLKRISSTTMRFDLFEPNSGATAINNSIFYTQTGYDANKITGRVVSGDFDGDGFRDDIAAFYDYGGGVTRIHVFRSNGSTMIYSGSFGWWNSAGYTASKITDRVVSGDFDKDGRVNDIAAFYDYGGGVTRIHVWLSSGTSLIYQGTAGWFNSAGYYANKITGRVVSVNIDKDGYFYDDIAVFYDYGGTETRMHTFKSDGTGFTYGGSLGAWSGSTYNASQITGRVVSLEAVNVSNVKGISDVLAFYDYGPTTDKYHIWKGDKNFFGNITIDYNHYKFCKTKSQPTFVEDRFESKSGEEIKQFPNPATDQFTYLLGDQSVTEIWVTNLQGQVVLKENVTGVRGEISCIELVTGTYICVYVNGSEIVDRKKISIIR